MFRTHLGLFHYLGPVALLAFFLPTGAIGPKVASADRLRTTDAQSHSQQVGSYNL